MNLKYKMSGCVILLTVAASNRPGHLGYTCTYVRVYVTVAWNSCFNRLWMPDRICAFFPSFDRNYK